jgi:hypothetical protein
MAYQYEELPTSRSTGKARGGYTNTRIFKVWSDLPADETVLLDPEAVALDAGIVALGTAHPTIPAVVLKSIKVVANAEVLNRGTVTYEYARSDRGGNQGGGTSTPDADGEIWTFNMVSQTTSISAVKNDGNTGPQQLTYDGANKKGAQLYSAVNFDDNGAQGVDVYRPAETVSVTKVYDSVAEVNQSYRETLRSLQNTVNDSTWPNRSEFKPGELLFLGADISYNLDEDTATVNYSFQAGNPQPEQKYEVWADPDDPDAVVTTMITVPKINPFQIVWAPLDTRIQKASATQKALTFTYVKSINVADVYEYGDFTQLKIEGN